MRSLKSTQLSSRMLASYSSSTSRSVFCSVLFLKRPPALTSDEGVMPSLFISSSVSIRRSIRTFANWGISRLSASIDRKSVVKGKSVSVRVDLGGRRIIKKKTKDKREYQHNRNKK